MNYNSSKIESCEKRSEIIKPIFNFSLDYLHKYGAYFEENYGLRNEFTKWQSKIKLKVFKSSSNPEQIIQGENSWLFYNSKDDQQFGSYSKTNLLNKGQLILFKKLHTERKNELKKKNISYILAVWPDKNTIYHNELPFQMRIQIKDTISKSDQITAYLKKTKSDLILVNTKNDVLINNKQTLYLKNDTHWNSLGAFYAYRKFMLESFSIFKTLPFNYSDFILKNKKIKGGDLLGLLGLCDKNVENEITPILKLKKQPKIINDNQFENSYGKYNKNANCNLKVLFFRDSYADALIPFFSLHFKHSYFYRSYYDQKIIDLIKPDVVVVCNVERYF